MTVFFSISVVIHIIWFFAFFFIFSKPSTLAKHLAAGSTLCQLQVIMCFLMMLVYYLFNNAETSNMSSQLEKLFRLTWRVKKRES